MTFYDFLNRHFKKT